MVLSIVNASAYSNFADAVSMAVGGILYIPPGTQLVRQAVWLPNNIYIEGAVNSVLTPDYTNYGANWINVFDQWMFVATDKQNVTIENLTIDMNTAPRTSSNKKSGLYIKTSSNVKLLGVQVMQADNGINIYGSTDMVIDSPRLINCGDDRDIPISDSGGDGLYIGITGDTIIPCQRVHIRNAYIKSSDRQGRIGYCLEGAIDCTFDKGFVQGYDREVHWENANTKHCKMTDSTIVHKPSEIPATYFWNGLYKTHACLYYLGRGNSMRGNTFRGEGVTGSWYNGYAIDNNDPLEIFKDNIGEGIMTWVPSGRTAPDSSNIKIS